jgi:hypothetical protein
MDMEMVDNNSSSKLSDSERVAMPVALFGTRGRSKSSDWCFVLLADAW